MIFGFVWGFLTFFCFGLAMACFLTDYPKGKKIGEDAFRGVLCEGFGMLAVLVIVTVLSGFRASVRRYFGVDMGLMGLILCNYGTLLVTFLLGSRLELQKSTWSVCLGFAMTFGTVSLLQITRPPDDLGLVNMLLQSTALNIYSSDLNLEGKTLMYALWFFIPSWVPWLKSRWGHNLPIPLLSALYGRFCLLIEGHSHQSSREAIHMV